VPCWTSCAADTDFGIFPPRRLLGQFTIRKPKTPGCRRFRSADLMSVAQLFGDRRECRCGSAVIGVSPARSALPPQHAQLRFRLFPAPVGSILPVP
jgi:hypothetical protein